MGMTIDEAIYCMESYLPSDDYTHCTECKYYGCKDNKTCKSSEAHQKAINIMRKYQKIQEIIEVWHQDIYAKDFECIAEVAEVIEDGKID